jgi:uncharacterized protein (TIGR00725 family)
MGWSFHIAVIGPGRCSPEQYEEALEVGRLIAGCGAVVVCGGLSGVMAAAARGAKEAGGCTIGILPGHDRSAANPYIDHAVSTGLGEARNLIVVSSGDVVIAVGTGYGTLSEIGLAAKIGRPVVILHGWDLQGYDTALYDDTAPIHYAASPAEAVDLARCLHMRLRVAESGSDGS